MVELEFEKRTRGGYEYHIYEQYDGNIFGRVKIPNAGWHSVQWEIDGKFMCTPHNFDLLPKWEPKRGEPVWVRDEGEIEWIPRVSSGGNMVYDRSGYIVSWDEVAPWNDGNPPAK